MNQLGTHVMINNGLKEMAANAVELVVDDRTGIAYAVYLSSEASFGESSDLVNLVKFNILQPSNTEWVTVFDRISDFDGARLSECNVIDLDRDTVRVFAVNLETLQLQGRICLCIRESCISRTPRLCPTISQRSVRGDAIFTWKGLCRVTESRRSTSCFTRKVNLASFITRF